MTDKGTPRDATAGTTSPGNGASARRPRALNAQAVIVKNSLQTLGLTEREIGTYSALVAGGPMTPSQIARATRQSRGHIYASLDEMCQRGLVELLPLKPARFAAIPLRSVLAVSLAESNSLAVLLRETLEQLGPGTEAAAAHGPSPHEVRLLSGRRAVASELARMIHSAEHAVRLGAGGNALLRLAKESQVLIAALGARRRGVDFSCFYPATPEARRAADAIERVVGPGGGLAFPPAESFPVLIAQVDDTVLICISEPDDDDPSHGADVGIRVRSRAFGAFLSHRFAVLRGLSACTGRAAMTPPEAMVRYIFELGRRPREVLALVPNGMEGHLRGAGNSLPEIYRSLRQSGADLRAVVEDNGAAPGAFDDQGLWQVRRQAALDVTAIIVDRRCAFVAFPASGEEADALVRFVDDPREVAHYVRVFERAWDGPTAQPSPVRLGPRTVPTTPLRLHGGPNPAPTAELGSSTPEERVR